MEETNTSSRHQDVDGSGHTGQPEHTPPGQNLELNLEIRPRRNHLQSTTTAAPQAGSPLQPAPSSGGEDQNDHATSHSTTGAPAREFGDLPKEIREMIWEQAWCGRLVKPAMSPCFMPHKFGSSCRHCRGRVRHAPSRDPPVAFVNREARDCARRVARPLSVWPRDWSPDPGKISNGRVFWFNRHTDVIWLCWSSLQRAVDLCEPTNHGDVLNAALDPRTDIMLDIGLFYACPTRGAQNAILNLLYHRYLKTRSDVYLRVESLSLALNSYSWKQALEWNLFREYEGQSLLVPLDDVDTLSKCLTLRRMSSDLRHHDTAGRIQLLVEDDLRALWRKYTIHRLLRIFGSGSRAWPPPWRRADRHVLPDLQTFVLHIADFLLESHMAAPPGSGLGERIVGPDGRLREGHPAVKRFDFRLPEFHPVCVFEVPARRRVSATGGMRSGQRPAAARGGG